LYKLIPPRPTFVQAQPNALMTIFLVGKIMIVIGSMSGIG